MKKTIKLTQIYILFICVTHAPFAFSQNVLTYFPETNGKVYAVAIKGDTAYIGGYFTIVGGLNRNYLAAINIRTGAVLNWNPGWMDGFVNTITVSKTAIYVGGQFSIIGTQHRSSIAAFDATTGNLTNWNPTLVIKQSGLPTVNHLLLSDNKLFVTGYFDSINGQAILKNSFQQFAVLDTVTGQILNWFTPNGNIYTAITTNNTFYVGGDFNTIGGQSRTALAAVYLSNNTISNWNPNPNGRISKIIMKNGKIYVGGTFSTMGSSFKNGLCYIDTATGLSGNWNPLTTGSQINDMAITSDAIFLIGTGAASGLFSYDLLSGNKIDFWSVGGANLTSIASYGDTVIIGGSFSKVGWVSRNNLCAVTRGLSLGVNEVNNTLQKINVFPNPATNKISFSVNETNNKTLSVIITNILGETVFNNTLNYQKDIEIPVTDLNSGIYFIKIQSGNNAYAGKFVKE